MEDCMMSHEESDFNYKEKKNNNKIGVFNWCFSLVPVSTRKNIAIFLL